MYDNNHYVYARLVSSSETAQKLIAMEDAAKAAGKGKWAPEVVTNPETIVRAIKWTIDNPRQFVDSFHQKPVDGKILRQDLCNGFTYLQRGRYFIKLFLFKYMPF